MRVLLLAEDCNPEWPSLPVVGYNACRAIADAVEAVVVTQVRNRPNLTKHGFGRATVEYVDTEDVAGPVFRLGRWLRGGTRVGWTINQAVHYPAYLTFEHRVWRRFRRELEAGRFDVVHRVTPMTPTLPSVMAARSPVPFVLGPLNGGLPWPPAFSGELRREKEWLTYARGAYRLMPYYRATYVRSAAILAGFAHTIADLPPAARTKAIHFPEVGIDPALFAAPPERTPDDRLAFLFAGRLVPYKCPDVAVAAFAASPLLRKHRLLVLGDGPERPALERMVKEQNLDGSVELAGQVTQAEVAAAMRRADVFVFPSVRELGAGVIVEAMASGLACVVADYGAPGALVGRDRGLRVPIGPKEELTAGFRRALEGLASDRDRAARLGELARAHAVAEYAWAAKAHKTVAVYDWVLGRRAAKPEPFGLAVG